MQIETTIDVAKSIVAKLLQKQLDGENPPPVFLWGPPGLGKSDIVRQVAEEKGVDLFDVRLGQRDFLDVRGMPYVEDRRMKCAVPADYPPKEAKGILFLDELSTAPPENQAAAYQLVLERMCGEYRLPDGVFICAAGNRAGDNAVAHPTSSALANRMMHIELKPDHEAWCRWAAINNIAPEIIGFIRLLPDMLFELEQKDCERGWASPRSWASVSKVLSYDFEPKELQVSINGLIGASAASHFLAYLKNCRELGDIRNVMLNPKEEWNPPTKKELFLAVASAIAHWVWNGKNKKESEKLMDGFFRIILQLPTIYARMALLDAISGKDGEARAQQLHNHAHFSELQKKLGSNNVKE